MTRYVCRTMGVWRRLRGGCLRFRIACEYLWRRKSLVGGDTGRALRLQHRLSWSTSGCPIFYLPITRAINPLADTPQSTQRLLLLPSRQNQTRSPPLHRPLARRPRTTHHFHRERPTATARLVARRHRQGIKQISRWNNRACIGCHIPRTAIITQGEGR